jgi:hypothetical protein
LERWLLAKRVVVLSPAGPEGPRRLAAAGASRVLVVGGACPAEPGVEVFAWAPGELPVPLPLRPASVDAVLCIEAYASLSREQRVALIADARRVLRSGGVLAVWGEALETHEHELRAVFPQVAALAQLRWSGVSLAPVAEAATLEVRLVEDLLAAAPPAGPFLVLGAASDLAALTAECVILPLAANEVVTPQPTLPPPLPPTLPPMRPRDPAISPPVIQVRTSGSSAPIEDSDVLAALFEAPGSSTSHSYSDVLAALFEAPSVPSGASPSATAAAEIAALREQVVTLIAERDDLNVQTEALAAQLRRALAHPPEPPPAASLDDSARIDLSGVTGVSGLLPLPREDVLPDPAHMFADEGSVDAPRATVDLALDRDRLREELTRRTADIQALETRLWQAEEEAEKERLENVRLVTDVDRLREQVDRSRVVEQERVQELEHLGHELRRLEVAYAELQGQLATRDQRLRELAAATADTHTLPPEVAELQFELHELGAQRDQAQALERASADLARRRERELEAANRTIRELRRTLEEHAGVAANLRGELAVVQVRIEQHEDVVPRLQERLREQQRKTVAREEEVADLQRRLEVAVAEQQHLRRKLRLQRQDLETLAARKGALESDLQRQQDELDGKRRSLEQMQKILSLGSGEGSGSMAEVSALRVLLTQQTREHAEQLARVEAQARQAAEQERERLQRVQLEATIRGEEQEYLIFQLDTAEQRIWEMSDATDRSAARLAAGLAQLEKQKEQYEDLIDQLEVTRNLLAEAQAQVVELERQLAGERAKLARVTFEPGAPAPTRPDEDEDDGAEPGTFDVLVDDPVRDELAPVVRRERDPGAPDPLADIDFDDEGEEVSMAVRLAGGYEPSDVFDPGNVQIDLDDDDPGVVLPSDMRVQIDLDDEDSTTMPVPPAPPPQPRPLRSLPFLDDDEDAFTIDTEAIEIATPTQVERPPGRPGFDQKLADDPNSRIVIEVLDDEPWPEEDPPPAGT